MEYNNDFRESGISPTSPNSDNNLLALKKARKQIESDAQLLANRIALLKQEELKAWKKIEETKKKAKDVYLLKKKNEERVIQKQSKSAQNNDLLKDTQKSSAEIRKQKEKEREDKLHSIYTQKHASATTLKKQSKVNDAKKKEFTTKVEEINQSKSQKIKEAEYLVELKKREALEQKLAQNRLDYERRMAEEELLKRQKELEVLEMEKLEMELIKRLQHTQSLQKTAYEELQSALDSSPTEYARRYFNGENAGTPSEGSLSPTKSPQNIDIIQSPADSSEKGIDGENRNTRSGEGSPK